uniref:Uncharacterized protein n=2 Tax=Meloidogyne enterolobii TaxID=390850 RepID=A0A6V7W8G1_MELEN|nr:unnamed protein product [Meloidogyne enterolobii]
MESMTKIKTKKKQQSNDSCLALLCFTIESLRMIFIFLRYSQSQRNTQLTIFHQISIILTLIISLSSCQFNARNYPDPRIDPFSCRLILPGQVCDPAEILTPDERRILNEKITRLQQITANIKNTSPACADTTRNTNLHIVIALMEKLGAPDNIISRDSLNIEKFTNQLRSKYQNYQDSLLCDTLVLIVNSRSDRQVFTVAGRDAKLSQDVLQTAFHRSVGHFRLGNYAQGFEGMVEYIVSAYGSAHIVQTPAIGDGVFPTNTQTLSTFPSSSGTGQFTAIQGVRQKTNINKLERFDFDEIPEEERLWVRILVKALAQCGDDLSNLTFHVKAIAEEAMDISLKLISDLHYNKIEEELQNTDKESKDREKAWLRMKPYLENLYSKYKEMPNNLDQCPERKT